MIGAACSRRAMRRTAGALPRTLSSTRYRAAIRRSISPAIGELPLSKRLTKRRRTWVALQEYPLIALEELQRMLIAAAGAKWIEGMNATVRVNARNTMGGSVPPWP